MIDITHGGCVNVAAEEFNIPRDKWLDLSTGINPSGYSLDTIPADIWQRLPEDDDGLESIAVDYYGCKNLLVTPGSQWSISRLPHWCRAQGNNKDIVLLPELGYREHYQAWQMAGFNCEYYSDKPTAEQLENCSALLVINPNNPSGRLFDKEQLLQWRQQLNSTGAWLIVDEAFIDCRPECSLSTDVGAEGLIVLRSLGKFFGLAGARVGALLAWPQLLQKAQQELGPWALANPSRWAAKKALSDCVWQQAMRKQLPLHSQRLKALLQLSFNQQPEGCELFQTLWLAGAEKIYHQLAEQGILVRLLNEYQRPGLRFGLPENTEENWQRLDAALSGITIDV